MRIYTFPELQTIISECNDSKELTGVAIYIFENAGHYCRLLGSGVMKTFGVMLKNADKKIKSQEHDKQGF